MKNLVFVSIFYFFLSLNSYSQNIADTVGKKNISDTLIVVGVGDIMLGTILPSRASLPKNEDCSGELTPTSEYFKTADVAFCNLEGVFTDTPEGRKKCKNPKICYTFGMPTKFVNCLVDAGFDLISNANNHCADFGQRGRESTAKTLKDAGLHFAGTLAYPYTIYEKDSIKYGFCAFSPESGNCRFNNYTEAAKTVKYLDSICDVVIVSFHSGAEGAACQHVTKKDEMFMGYNRGNVYEFSHRMIDAGADVIFGHGPHVTRAVEIYKDRFIAYSMGNYCTYSNISVAGVCGVAPIIKLWVDKNGKYLKGQIIPTYQDKYQPPKVDSQKRALKIIQNLTREDFPEVKMFIDENGFVSLLK
jgi:hypothetical protein